MGLTLLIIGRDGQLSTELAALAIDDPQIAGFTQLGLDVVDLTKPETGAEAIRDHDADVVINATAYTAVDKAEEDEATALLINGDGPRVMAEAAAGKSVPFLHVSTDYVFEGSGTARWKESDATGPLGAYGRTKLVGEEGVIAAGGVHGILRTSWVFSAHGANFVKTMLKLAESRDALNVVNDQIGGPTAARDIAKTLLIMAKAMAAGEGESGVYHYAGAPDASWADFAHEIFAQAGKGVTVTGIPTSEYPTPATRPLNSRLECQKIAKVFGIPTPDWRKSLADVLKEL
jgi:dTDP-4-dehydrorhamnose reductase